MSPKKASNRTSHRNSPRILLSRFQVRVLATVLVAVLVTGCAGLPAVYNSVTSGTYKVRGGDTLYSIAFRYGLDYKSLARINGIQPPYTIYVDQVIKLRGSAKLPDKDSGPVGKPPVTASTRNLPPPIEMPGKPISAWRWPLRGEIIGAFSLKNPINKGIDIAGEKGQKVVAAADGVVVYAGGNLRGYGKLVIIKHNDKYLSAYGNNDSMLVKEGESVKAGKSIARVGKSASDVEMLHFEIRRDGKPVDPLRYLPER